MNWEMIGATGEWAGALAVVITLVYLSSQIRQAKDATRQATEQRRGEAAQRQLHLIVENPAFAELLTRYDSQSTGEMARHWGCSRAEAHQLVMFYSVWGSSWEEYYLSESRDPKRWATVERRIAGQLSTEPGRSFWKNLNHLYSPEFVSCVDELLATLEVEPTAQ